MSKKKRAKKKKHIKKKSKKRSKKSKHKKKLSKKKHVVTKKNKILFIPDEKALPMLKQAHLKVPNFIICKKEKQLDLIEKKVGYPCILKGMGRSISKKSEVHAIKIVSDKNSAINEFKNLKKIKGVDKVLAQYKIKGAELIVTVSQDINFGYIISVGIGGEYAQILKDVSFRIIPTSKKEIETMLTELKGWSMIKSSHRINTEKISEEITKIGKFAISRKIKQITIDPLICERECFSVDAKIIL